MPSSGYGGSVVGADLGTFPSVESVQFGGLEVTTKKVRCITDADKVGTTVPLAVDDGDVTVKMVHDATTKALYAHLETHAKAHTEDTFTMTDPIGNTKVGLGYIKKVGDVNMDTEAEMTFTVIIAAKTTWTFTPAA